MSSNNNECGAMRNMEANKCFRNSEKKVVTTIKTNIDTSDVKYANRTEISSQEPRKIAYNNNPLMKRSIIEIGTRNTNKMELDSDDQEVKLVKIRSRYEDDDDKVVMDDVTKKISTSNEHQKRTSFNITPVNYTNDGCIDNGPITKDTDNYDDEEGEDEYFVEDEDRDGAEQQDELTNLSRQSMMPVHELIAYYKYIQQGDDQAPSIRSQISRQSSSASDQLVNQVAQVRSDDVINISSRSESEFQNQNETLDLESPIVRRTISNEQQSVNSKQEEQDRLQQAIALKENRRRVRANVVLELINSERDFVQHLKDVVEGYLYPARKHPDIFTGERINTIFSNIEQLYEFQRKFLDTMESCINWEDLSQSEVGRCFLEHEKGFSVYHHYCNNHTNAISELQDLYTRTRFVKFFEACRLLQNMIDISLDGFLLTPIQKICKYPLQLNELLKNTDQEHPDYQHVVNALESMRNCANLANERKRRIEALVDVMSFHEKFENWFGPKLSNTSSILIHSGEVSKMSSHTWSQGIQLHLFDHLLLISKRDLLKRNSLILKARVCMDDVTEISDADEYKPKRSFKLYCGEQKRWFVFTTRSETERDEWIRAFERERNLVESDENEGFHITEREIGVARRALHNRRHSRSARYRHKRPDTTVVDQLDLDDANTIMNRTLSLPSCIHPSHVMNFVEESKTSTSSKRKNASPNSSTRSPINGSQSIADPEATGSWFRKMGSKKLSKSQIYNISGPGSASKSSCTPTIKSRPTSPANYVLDMTAATKYDQLEKKHRDHMVSEEQARMYRLNNDLPPPIFGDGSPATISNRSSKRNSRSMIPHLMGRQSWEPAQTPIDSDQRLVSDVQSLNINKDQSNNNSEHEFETTIVLASGKVVRVREDAV